MEGASAADSGSWSPDELSAAGQVAEFLVWAEITAQSRGSLHVFLPIADRGIDALVHDRLTGRYTAVQVKSRSRLSSGLVSIVIAAAGLVDDDALIIAVLVHGSQLAPRLLVIDEAEFRRLAHLTHNGIEPVYDATFSVDVARPHGPFEPQVIDRDTLALRLGFVAPEGAATLGRGAAAPDPRDRGTVGEVEVIRRLVEAAELNLFRPFPDLETVEIAVRHLGTRRVLGLQIKTLGIDQAHPEGPVAIREKSFRESGTTWVVVVAWRRDSRAFHDECLFIPSAAIRSITFRHAEQLRFTYRPGSTARGRLTPYRVPLAELAEHVLALLR